MSNATTPAAHSDPCLGGRFFGPSRVIDRMIAAGIDLDDQSQVRAWLDAVLSDAAVESTATTTPPTSDT